MITSAPAPFEDRLLAKLAELGLGMAERLHEVAVSTREPLVVATVATAFHQVSRGVRQSLMLRARFAAGAPFGIRGASVPTTAPAPAPKAAAQAAPGPERIGWNEYERLDDEEALDVDEGLDAAEGDVRSGGPEAGVARMRANLTAVSRVPALAAMPALRPHAAALSKRAALLGAAGPLRAVNSS
jgi:hypothetical protein